MSEYLTNQEGTPDHKDIVSIEAQDLEKILQDSTHCAEVGNRLNADCDAIKAKMGNLDSFNKKVSEVYGKIKENTVLTQEDESALRLYYVIKKDKIPSEQEYQAWREGLDPQSTNKPSTNESQTETLSDNEGLEGIPTAIIMSDIIDKAENIIDEFIKKKELGELQDDKLDELYDEFIETLGLTDKLDELNLENLKIIKKNLSTLLEESIKVRNIIDNASLDLAEGEWKEKKIFLGLYDDHEGNRERRRGKFNTDDEVLLEKYKNTESFKIEQDGPALMITLPNEIFKKIVSNDTQTQGLTSKYNGISICFVDARNDEIAVLEEQQKLTPYDNTASAVTSISFSSKKKTRNEIKKEIEDIKSNVQKTKKHEQKHAINKIFMAEEEKGLYYPKDEMLARLHEKATLFDIWETLVPIGNSYDTSFDNDKHSAFKQQIEQTNKLKKQFNDYLLSGNLTDELETIINSAGEDVKNYINQRTTIMDNIKEGMRCIIVLDSLCDDTLFTDPTKRKDKINNILKGKKDWNKWKKNDKKIEKLPKCVINLLSTTKMSDRGKIIDYVKENGLTKEGECNIPKCK